MSKDKRLLGRGSEVLSNEKLYKIVKQLETLSLDNDDKRIKKPDEEKSLWIDPNDSDDLKFYKNGQWNPFYKNKFRITTEILEQYAPKNPVKGQLWIKDGVLMYFDGMEWNIVKAGDIDNTQFNISNYHDFIIIDPLYAEGEIVTDSTAGMPLRKSQFLIPNADTDKFFIDGHINEDYERLTNVAIQYETERIEDKITSAVHINPSNLIDIRKSFLVVDKNSSDNVIRVNNHNKEFYGFTHGKGKILVRGIDYITTSGNYIQLREKAKRKFDFIMVVEYIFGKTKHKGKLLKNRTNIRKNSSISIIPDKNPDTHIFIVFENGIAKTIDQDNYKIIKNKLTLSDNLKNKNIQILAINHDNLIGKGKVKDGTVELDLDGVEKISDVFAIVKTSHGYVFREIKDININLGKIENVIDGSRYLLFDTTQNENKTSIIKKQTGTISDNKIKIKKLLSKERLFLVINGESVPKSEYKVDYVNSEIIVDKKYDFLDYILFNDNEGNNILDNKVREILIPINNINNEKYDKSMVYIDESLVCDPNTVISYNLPSSAYENEVKKILSNEGQPKWYIYNNKKWVELKNKLKKTINLIDALKINEEEAPIDKIIEVYHLNNNEEIRMEIKRAIKKHYRLKDDKFEDELKINIIGNKAIASYNEEKTFYFDIKEVQIKMPSYIYSDNIGIILDSQNNSDYNDAIKHIELKLEEEITKEIRHMNNKVSLRFNITRRGSRAIVEVVQDFGSTSPDYKEEIGIIEHLEYSTNTYIEDNNMLNLINSFDGYEINSYSYKFSSYIEEPRKIKEFEIDLSKNEDGFITSYSPFFTQGNEELSVYLDGIKQYEFIEDASNKKFKFYGQYSILDPRFAKAIVVSEPVERNDALSAYREIIRMDNNSLGMFNTFKTNLNLYPGYNRFFIDGVRQSGEDIEILDSNTFMIKNVDKINNESLILIEHKNDLSIKEKRILIKEPLTGGIIDLNKYDIDKSILETREEILIYINGVLFGNNYSIDRETETITLQAFDSDNIGKDIIYYEKVLEYSKMIEELEKILKDKNTSFEQKEEAIKVIKEIEEDINSIKNNSNISEDSIIFEWR